MITCPTCGAPAIGFDEFATCSNPACGGFILPSNALPSCPVADRLRAEMTANERRIEFQLRLAAHQRGTRHVESQTIGESNDH